MPESIEEQAKAYAESRSDIPMIQNVMVAAFTAGAETKPNFDKLKTLCQDYNKYVRSKKYHEDNDYETYIFEAAIEAIFGEELWVELRKK